MANAEKKQFKVFVREVAEAPKKLRLVANLVRGKKVETAIAELTFLTKKGALPVRKAIESGAANARNLAGIEKKDLVVSEISVDEATPRKRYRIASRSRVAVHIRRRSHINLILAQK